MISKELLEMIRCPRSGSRLKPAAKPLLERLREAISQGKIRNRAGDAVTRPAEGGLVDEGETLLYLVYDDIPDLIADEAVPLDQLESVAMKEANADG